MLEAKAITNRRLSKERLKCMVYFNEPIYVLLEDSTYDRVNNEEDLAYYIELNYPLVSNVIGLRYVEYSKSRRSRQGG